MIQILFGREHEVRSRSLSQVTANSSVVSAIGPALDKRILKITTLCFWGHGDSIKFCGMNPVAFIAKVKEWKKWNPTINTIEMITCNSRHGGWPLGSEKNPEEWGVPWVTSYTDIIKPELRKLGVTLKALPIGMGHRVENRWSILQWSKETLTWLYITTGGVNDTDEMFEAARKVELHTLYQRTQNFVIAGTAVKASDGLRKYTIDFGTLSQLRAALVTLA